MSSQSFREWRFGLQCTKIKGLSLNLVNLVLRNQHTIPITFPTPAQLPLAGQFISWLHLCFCIGCTCTSEVLLETVSNGQAQFYTICLSHSCAQPYRNSLNCDPNIELAKWFSLSNPIWSQITLSLSRRNQYRQMWSKAIGPGWSKKCVHEEDALWSPEEKIIWVTV